MNQITAAFQRINNLPPMFKGLLTKNLKARKKDKGWSTKLSFKTYHQLKNTGVLVE